MRLLYRANHVYLYEQINLTDFAKINFDQNYNRIFNNYRCMGTNYIIRLK